MTRDLSMIKRSVIIVVLCAFLAILAGPLFAQTPSNQETREMITLLKEQNRELSRDLRRIRREIAALRAQIEEPGIKDVFAGIGYIFGLFGAGALVAARRKD